jgi:hypothetical protein
MSVPSPSITTSREQSPFYGHNQMLASWLRYRMNLVFCEFTMNSNTVVSFHHTTAMKCHLEDDETERQLKCKNCDVGLCSLICFEEYHTKARFNQMTRSCGGTYIYIKQITRKKGMYIEFYYI